MPFCYYSLANPNILHTKVQEIFAYFFGGMGVLAWCAIIVFS
jgi:hypothetical protein